MDKIRLKVVTHDKLFFDDYVDNVIVRTTEGDVGIMKNHINYLSALSTGKLRIFVNGNEKVAVNTSGLVYVDNDGINIVSDYCEWIDNININYIKDMIKYYEDMSKENQENAKIYKYNIEQQEKIIRLI